MEAIHDEFNITKTLSINYKHKFPYPDNLYNKEAQNEFCRMKITKFVDGYKLECSEIWGEAYTVYDGEVIEKYKNKRSFEIISDYENLHIMLTNFYKEPNKFEDFNVLKKKYSNYIKSDINNCSEKKQNNNNLKVIFNKERQIDI